MLGMSYWCYRNLPIERVIEIASDIGFDFIQLHFDYSFNYKLPSLSEIKKIKNVAKNVSLNFTVFHGPTIPCDMNYVEGFMKVAKFLECEFFVVHMLRNKSLSFLRMLIRLAEKFKLIVAIENSWFDESKSVKEVYTPQELNSIIQTIDSQFLKLCFDCSHAFESGFEVIDFFGEIKENVKVFHISDATRRRGHLPIGKGDIDLERFVKLIKPLNCPLVLEVNPEYRGEVQESFKRVKSLINKL